MLEYMVRDLSSSLPHVLFVLSSASSLSNLEVLHRRVRSIIELDIISSICVSQAEQYTNAQMPKGHAHCANARTALRHACRLCTQHSRPAATPAEFHEHQPMFAVAHRVSSFEKSCETKSTARNSRNILERAWLRMLGAWGLPESHVDGRKDCRHLAGHLWI